MIMAWDEYSHLYLQVLLDQLHVDVLSRVKNVRIKTSLRTSSCISLCIGDVVVV